MALRDYLPWNRVTKSVTLTTEEPKPDLGSAITEEELQISGMAELGASGLRRQGGYLFEEILRELAGQRYIRVFKDMAENEPVIGALLFAIEMLIRGVTWDVKPAGPENKYLKDAQFLKECMTDMSHSFSDLIVEILSMLVYGWSYFETVYKVRDGEAKDGETAGSRFKDGQIGWRKIALRSQDSLLQWDFDRTGGVRAMIQLPPPDYKMRRIPIEKAILFRPKAHKNSPEGRSILRNAHIAWYMKKQIQRIEAIGVERDLAGLPTLGVPPRMMSKAATPEDKEQLANYKTMLTQMRRDEGEGFIYPLQFDKDGHEMYRLQLLASTGRRQIDTNPILQRYTQEMAMTALADFILIGHGTQGASGGKGGTALVENKTDIFNSALAAWVDAIRETLNRYEVPRLFRLNGKPLDKLPEFTAGKIETVNLIELGAYVGQLAGAGMPLFPDDELENILRARASLPEKPEKTEEQVAAEGGDGETGEAILQGLRDAMAASGKKPNGQAGPPRMAREVANQNGAANANGKGNGSAKEAA